MAKKKEVTKEPCQTCGTCPTCGSRPAAPFIHMAFPYHVYPYVPTPIYPYRPYVVGQGVTGTGVTWDSSGLGNAASLGAFGSGSLTASANGVIDQ